MTDLTPIRRALLSVSDKTGLVELAQALAAHDVEILSTGGTARALADAGLRVRPVEDVTGFPEMMDGRIKTLHPRVHGGILARRDVAAHLQAMEAHGIEPIDLVCINLYPFEQTVARAWVTFAEAVEQIDIGGPAMVRSAAKNHAFVTVVTDPSQYGRVMEELERHGGATSGALRRELAHAAFARTAAYDRAIATYLAGDEPDAVLDLRFSRVQSLRYGENPHQAGAVYRLEGTAPGLVGARQHHGRELSYNNLNDAAGAWRLVGDLRRVAPTRAGVAVIKHTNPCGAAVGSTVAAAVRGAIAGDPLAAYGGILASNVEVDEQAAEAIAAPDRFFEVVLAPSYTPGALACLGARWKHVRVLEVAPDDEGGSERRSVRTIPGGALVQEVDRAVPDVSAWTHAAGPAPTRERLEAAALIWLFAKHLTSNAIAIGGPDADGSGEVVRLFGAGAGQMDRVASCEIALRKAGERARDAIVASDAFFPFPDGPTLLIDAGVTMLVHPGGSKRDEDTFALCNTRGVTCMLTGVRHFRH